MPAKRHILYVDDDEALIFLITRLLLDAGYAVTACISAPEALQLLEDDQRDGFDLVVSDMNMPGMSGLEFAGQALARHPQLPLVMVSGFLHPEQQQQAAVLGVRKLILKPNSIHALIKELTACCEQLLRP